MNRWRSPWFPWVVYAATLASLLPVGAILAVTNPMPEGACSGIGFGCSLYGWDAVGFGLIIFGIPFLVVFAVVLGVLSLPAIRRPAVSAGCAAVGFAIPWLFMLYVLPR